MRALLIDNYDSYTFNLFHLLGEGQRTRFAGIPQDFLAVHYHSLVVGTVPPQLRVTAWTPDGVIMALEHRERPLFGVQFHPESVSTRHGRALLENFRDLTPRRWTAAKPVRTPAPRRTAPPGGSTELRRRRLETWCEPEAVFGALYAGHARAIWLDSSRSRRRPVGRRPRYRRCVPATRPRSPRSSGWASCPCSAPPPNGSCAWTATASSNRGR